MTRNELLQFMRAHRYAVQSTISPGGAPQAAVIGIAVTDDLGLVFDSVDTTRKVQNLRADPRIAFVIGGGEDEGRTLQYEGLADEPSGAERERLMKIYFEVFPDGPERLSWPGLVYVRVRPTWLRFSDFDPSGARIVELDAAALAAL